MFDFIRRAPGAITVSLLIHLGVIGLLLSVPGLYPAPPEEPEKPPLIQAQVIDLSALRQQEDEESERKQQQEAERKAEEERKQQQEAERKAEEERKQQQEAERKAEEERKRKQEAERKAEEERKQQQEAERKAEEERKQQQEAERKAEEERQQREEDLRQRRAEELEREMLLLEQQRQQREADERERQRQLEEEHLRELQHQKRLEQQQQVVVSDYSEQIQGVVRRNFLCAVDGIGRPSVVEVRLSPGGHVISQRTLRSSGNSALDRCREAAVAKAGSLPIPNDDAIFNRYFRVFYLEFDGSE